MTLAPDPSLENAWLRRVRPAMVSVLVVWSGACGAESPHGLLMARRLGAETRTTIASLLRDGTFGADGNTVAWRGSSHILVASPAHPFAYLGSETHSTRGGRLRLQGEVIWSSLADSNRPFPAVGLHPKAPILAIIAGTGDDLLLRFIGVDPESGLPNLDDQHIQSFGPFPYCPGSVFFSRSGDYLWHSMSDCYKGTRMVRRRFSPSLSRAMPEQPITVSETEMIGPAVPDDDRFAIVGSQSGALKTFLLNGPSAKLVSSLQTSERLSAVTAASEGRWMVALVKRPTPCSPDRRERRAGDPRRSVSEQPDREPSCIRVGGSTLPPSRRVDLRDSLRRGQAEDHGLAVRAGTGTDRHRGLLKRSVSDSRRVCPPSHAVAMAA